LIESLKQIVVARTYELGKLQVSPSPVTECGIIYKNVFDKKSKNPFFWSIDKRTWWLSFFFIL